MTRRATWLGTRFLFGLRLPMEIKVDHWPRGGINIARGPLVYTQRILEDRKVDSVDKRSTPEFPA